MLIVIFDHAKCILNTEINNKLNVLTVSIRPLNMNIVPRSKFVDHRHEISVFEIEHHSESNYSV